MRDLKTLIILFKAYHSLIKQVKVSLESTELTLNEFTVLEALHSKETLTTQQLIDTVLIPNSSMTYVLDTLSKKQLIHRVKNKPDRRVTLLSLTSKGTDLFVNVYRHHFDHIRSILDEFTPDEEKTLQELLKRLGSKATHISE